MNFSELNRKLIKAAKANPPGDDVPYCFEQRIMAHLRTQTKVDYGAQWARALWRASVPCLAIMVLLSALSLWLPASSSNSGSTDLSQAMEKAVLAAVDQDTASDAIE